MTPDLPENLKLLTKNPLDSKRIRAIREARGLTQTQAGMMAFAGKKFPAQQWNAYECPRNGKPKRARYETILLLATALGCNVADLMQGATGGIQVISAPNVAPVPVAYTADDLRAAYQLGVEDGKKGQSLDVKA